MIREAINKEGMVAIAKVVFTSREHIIALEARGKGMIAALSYEVRDGRGGSLRSLCLSARFGRGGTVSSTLRRVAYRR